MRAINDEVLEAVELLSEFMGTGDWGKENKEHC